MQTISTRKRDLLLTSIGLGAALVYVLACASFSPDDSKVIFPVFEKDRGVGLAAYDRRSDKTSVLLTLPPGGEDVMLRAFWHDGRPGALWGEGNSFKAVLLPIDSSGPVRLLSIPVKESDPQMALMYPPAIAGQFLFLPFEKKLTRFDFSTGELTNKQTSSGWILQQQGTNFFYAAGLESDHGDSNVVEIGTLDPGTLQTHPLYQCDLGNELEVAPFVALGSSGSKMALWSAKEPVRCLLYAKGKPERQLPIPGNKGTSIGMSVFSPDEKTIYAVYVEKLPETNTLFGVLRLSLADGATEKTPIFKIRGHHSDDFATVGTFQIDLSHDGRTLAACNTYVGEGVRDVEPADRGLFLVDVSVPKPAVKRIPMPPLGNTGAAGPKR